MKLQSILNLIVLLLSIVVSGCCSIGVKEKHTVVYVTFGHHADAFNDLIHVATNKKIPVTVGDIATELDVGGYIVIHPQDLIILRDAANGE